MECQKPFYLRRQEQWVPCGHCNFCLQTRRAAWSFRLKQECKVANSSAFITLTYSPEELPLGPGEQPVLLKSDFQDFMKKLRNADNEARGGTRRKWLSKLRYYSVGEYSPEGRPHYHSIMFNLENSVYPRIPDIWAKGFTHVGKVQPASIHYVTGYVIDREGDWGMRTFPFSCISNRSGGLGKNYMTQEMANYHKQGWKGYTRTNGQFGPLPRYYKDRMFTHAERAKMNAKTLEQMDKQYEERIAELSKLYADPHSYYELQIQQAYNKIRLKKH